MSKPAFDYYLQELEQKIILHLAEMKGVDLSTAMDWYYRSRLADQITQNDFDMAFLDSKYLARDLVANEPELFNDEPHIFSLASPAGMWDNTRRLA